MLRRILSLFCGLLISGILLSQAPATNKAPIKFRLLMTSVTIEDVNPDEIAISLNAFNTGRNPIDFSQFNSVPKEMEIKFEESFYRSNLSALKEEILSSLLNRNLTITNGKILRNLRFNLPGNPELYKQLTKKEKRFTKNYVPRDKTNAPEVKYKTAKKKSSGLASTLAKINKKKTNKSASKEEDLITKKENIEVQTSEDKVVKVESKYQKTTTKDISTPKKEQIEIAAPIIKKKKSNPAVPTVKVETTKNETPQIEKTEIAESTIDQEIEKKETKKNIFVKNKEKKKEIEKVKKDSYKIEQASQKEDEKAILESLGVNDSKSKKSKNENGEGEVAFDTRAGVEASKNSYKEKSVCPDLILENITVVKKTSKWVTLEYTITNIGKGPAYLGKSKNSQGLAIRAFLSSSENLSRGSLPLGGGFVSYSGENSKELFPDNSFTTTLKLDIKKMTRFTPFVILNFDPFNVLNECDKANNYGKIKVGG